MPIAILTMGIVVIPLPKQLVADFRLNTIFAIIRKIFG